jgi:nucleotide-binding universal stress UspA family protein
MQIMGDMIHAISVGFDNSAGSQKALDFAVTEVLARRALLRVVGCLEVPIMSGDPCATVEEIADRRTAAAKALTELEQRLLREWPSLKLETRLVDGPARKVLREESADTDLLVVGREGVDRALPWLMGSTARSLSRHSHCPIAVVPTSSVRCPASRVVVGLESGDRKSVTTLRFAAEFAEVHECPVVVVANELNQAMLVARYYCGESAEGVHARGDLVGALIGTAKRDDVIIVGTRHSGRFASSLFGADTDPIVERSVTPVVIVPEVIR